MTHRHIENLNEIAWYRAVFPDKGAGNTRTHLFVQADTGEAVRAIVSEKEEFSMYDTSKGKVNRVGPLWKDIKNSFMMAGGANVLIDQLGNLKDRSDFS